MCSDGICSDHLKYASNVLVPLLAMCFTSFISHGFLPESMLSVVLVPVIYTIICLKSVCRSTFADCRSQFLLDRLGRCLKLIVSYRGTSSHEFASQFGLEFFYTRKNSQTTVGPITDRPRHRPSERRNNLKGILYLHARWRLTSQFTQMVTDDFLGAPKPPQSKRKLSALQRSSQARQRMRRWGLHSQIICTCVSLSSYKLRVTPNASWARYQNYSSKHHIRPLRTILFG